MNAVLKAEEATALVVIEDRVLPLPPVPLLDVLASGDPGTGSEKGGKIFPLFEPD